MVSRQAISDIPNALRTALAAVPAEIRGLVRRVRWGEGPLYVCGSGVASDLGQAAGYAFETLLGWPVVARSPTALQYYTPSLARPRSVLLLISPGEADPEMQELAQAALRRDATVIVLTNSPENSLAKLTEHVLVVRAPTAQEGWTLLVCLHAALNLFAVLAAGMLKRPGPHQETLEREFEDLPDQLDRLALQQASAVRSLAGELVGCERISVLGGGFYHYPAFRLARSLAESAGLAADGMEFTDNHSRLPGKRHAIVVLSGSHCKIKKLAHRAAAEWRVRGANVFAITDGNDRELTERSAMSLLVPTLAEVTGSTVSLFLGEWLAQAAARSRDSGIGNRE